MKVEKGVPEEYRNEQSPSTDGAIVSKTSAAGEGGGKRGGSGLPDEEAEGEDDDDEDIDEADG